MVKILAILLASQMIGLLSRFGVECLEYEVLKRYQDYEEREYPATTWISTWKKDYLLTVANENLYKKLMSYKNGNNAYGIKINTTSPARTLIIPSKEGLTNIFIMSFLIPTEFVESTPYPLDPEFFIERYPSTRYFVSTFNDTPTENNWLENYHKLAGLVKDDPAVDLNSLFAVWYYSAYDIFHYTNEVWIRKFEDESHNFIRVEGETKIKN